MGVKRSRFNDIMDKTVVASDRCGKRLTGKTESPHKRVPDLCENKGRDHSRNQPQADLAESECCIRSRYSDVARRNHPDSSAVDRSLDASDHGTGAIIDGPEHRK